MTDSENKQTLVHSWPSYSDEQSVPSQQPHDHFVTRQGVVFAGAHLMIDFWGAKNLNDLVLVEQALRHSADAGDATLLHIHLHHFTDSGGISGVAVLAESHISVHTWPERGFAAFDVFMCGNAKPEKTLAVLKQAFEPEKTQVTEHLRGRVTDAL